MKRKLEHIAKKAINEHTFPGCIIGVIKGNGKKTVQSFGTYTYNPNSPQIVEDSIFDVASITKAIPTASLALKAIDQGRIQLNDRLIKWVSEINNSNRNDILIKHLLTHTLDFGIRLSGYRDYAPEKILDIIFNAELQSSPGSRFVYSNATSILTGILVERVFRKKLNILAQEYFFDPLGMKDSVFKPNKKLLGRIVPTEIDNWRGGVVKGEVHDESAWVLNRAITPGSAGLFSTAPDLLIFLEMLLNEGVYRSNRIFSRETIKLFSTNYLEEIEESAGLGWELNQPRYMGNYFSKRTIGKTGFTGCVVICDLIKKIGIVFLSNYTFPHRKQDKELINSARRQIADAIFKKRKGKN